MYTDLPNMNQHPEILYLAFEKRVGRGRRCGERQLDVVKVVQEAEERLEEEKCEDRCTEDFMLAVP